MTIPCKPEAGLIIEANALYVLNMRSQGSITWSDLTGKTRVSTISWCGLDSDTHTHLARFLLYTRSLLIPLNPSIILFLLSEPEFFYRVFSPNKSCEFSLFLKCQQEKDFTSQCLYVSFALYYLPTKSKKDIYIITGDKGCWLQHI